MQQFLNIFLVHLLRSESMQRLLLTIFSEDRGERLSSWRRYEISSSLKALFFQKTKLIKQKHYKTRTKIQYHTHNNISTLTFTYTLKNTATLTHTNTHTHLDTKRNTYTWTTTQTPTPTYTKLSTHLHPHIHIHKHIHIHSYIHTNTDFCLTPLNKNLKKSKDFTLQQWRKSKLLNMQRELIAYWEIPNLKLWKFLQYLRSGSYLPIGY